MLLIDIIIPVLNEEKILKEQEQYYSLLSTKAHVIFVDGGSVDQTVSLAKRFGDVVISDPGRARQKNRGSQEARSDYLLFLHVDSFIDDAVLNEIPRVLQGDIVAGCFQMKIEDSGSIFRFYEKVVNCRAKKFGVYDGDLGLFVKKQAFFDVGQFDALPIMEDLKFGKKIRRMGKTITLPNTIRVSSRKWHEKGFVRTFMCYSLAYIQLWTGIPFFKPRHLLNVSKCSRGSDYKNSIQKISEDSHREC